MYTLLMCLFHMKISLALQEVRRDFYQIWPYSKNYQILNVLPSVDHTLVLLPVPVTCLVWIEAFFNLTHNSRVRSLWGTSAQGGKSRVFSPQYLERCFPVPESLQFGTVNEGKCLRCC